MFGFLCLSLFLVSSHLIGSNALTNAVNAPRECACTYEKLWLDIVFLVDVSDAVSRNNFEAMREVIKLVAKSIPIGQTGADSRIALSTFTTTPTRYGDLKSFANSAAVVAAADKMVYTGGKTVNLQKALDEASNIIRFSDDRENVQNLIVLFTASGFQCRHSSGSGTSDYPCTIASELTGNGNILQTIAVKLAGTQKPPLIDFNTPCFNLTNEANMMELFLNLACKANCFCQKPFTQFESQVNSCVEFGECVHKMEIPVGYYSAQIGCQFQKLSLADVFSGDKQAFLDGLAGVSMPYWTGMRLQDDGKTYIWENFGRDAQSGDYRHWMTGQPNITTGGGCPATQLNQVQSATVWKSDRCAWDKPSYFYFCQSIACDTDNYCATARI